MDENPVRTIRIKCQRFLRAPGKKKFFAATCVVVYIILSLLVMKYRSERNQSIKLLTKKKFLHYCNPAGPPLGNEHYEPMEYAQFKLKQVQVVVRHGDRSSVMDDWSLAKIFPQHTHMTPFNCELKTQNSQHAKKLDKLRKAGRFLKMVFAHKHSRSENVENFYLAENKICKPGQLTARGYLQHIYLGEYMMNVYGKRLDINIASVDEIMVYATPFKRTQQSAAAFLAGMLDKVFKNIPGNNSKKEQSVKIRVSPDDMGYFREDENNDIPPCSELQRIFHKHGDSYELSGGMKSLHPLMDIFSQIFNVSIIKLPKLTLLFDFVATHYCHHHRPQCGPGGCIDDEVNLELVKAVDWLMKMKYTPSAKLATYPLLSKITQRMLTHVSGEAHTKFTLYSTHDSTIAPLLIELGIFQDQWPPYASRIVFELWEAGGLLGSKITGENLNKYFVRVLYNGRDFTKKLQFCKEQLKFGKLCPLKAFVKALEGKSESMDSEYKTLCGRTV